jgi:ATP-binding cassette subfamily C (CFTR/MRP) protein 1
LDVSTQAIIFERLLGQRGLLRRWKTTVIMATGAVKFLSRADLIVVLSADGSVEGQGSFQELRAAETNATKFITSIDASPEDETKPDPMNKQEPKEAEKTHGAGSKSKPEDKKLDSARQNGDFGIYKYYFACISWTVVAMFLLLQFAYAFLCTFPSEYPDTTL